MRISDWSSDVCSSDLEAGPTLPYVSAPVLSRRARIAGYVALTKPRIIELLLITPVPTMLVAERGLPSLRLMICPVLGGTMAAGGANAVNMYGDRDIDQIMDPPQKRQLVTGVLSPRAPPPFPGALRALRFG